MHNNKLRCMHRAVCNLAGHKSKSIFSDQRKNAMLSSLEYKHFIFSLGNLANIFQCNSKKFNLKIQKMVRTIIEFIDTLSAFVEKLDNWK